MYEFGDLVLAVERFYSFETHEYKSILKQFHGLLFEKCELFLIPSQKLYFLFTSNNESLEHKISILNTLDIKQHVLWGLQKDNKWHLSSNSFMFTTICNKCKCDIVLEKGKPSNVSPITKELQMQLVHNKLKCKTWYFHLFYCMSCHQRNKAGVATIN
jgi:hypothetical protein